MQIETEIAQAIAPGPFGLAGHAILAAPVWLLPAAGFNAAGLKPRLRPMIPARDCFEPVMLWRRAARLRAARFRRRSGAPPRGRMRAAERPDRIHREIFRSDRRIARPRALPWRRWTGAARAAPAGWCRTRRSRCISMTSRNMTPISSAFMDQVVAPMLSGGHAPIALAHSMGGHILLRYLHRHPDRFAAGALLRADADVLHPRPAALAGARW